MRPLCFGSRAGRYICCPGPILSGRTMHLNRCQNHELGWTEGGFRATSSLSTFCRDFSCFRDGVNRFRFFIQKRRWCLFLRWPSLHHACGPCNPGRDLKALANALLSKLPERFESLQQSDPLLSRRRGGRDIMKK